ncbi:hypothetical protein BD65_1833 [Yersinia ruckeri]|uniref:hypothetical protein n=1 Tax=Yersinia ruckeri TaxID=29486 RepID=UPI0005ACC839|nr:hypothetical protein [Yersinia ruckeri]AJI95841.1 hypothetical protein BD65_1833 [Yersinia ruckeri]
MNISDKIKFYEGLSSQANIKNNCNLLANNKINTRVNLLMQTGVKVRNAPIKLNDEAKEKNILSANKIRFYFRVHLKKLDKMQNNGDYTNNRFIKTIYNGNDKSISGREYYFHKDHRPVYRPNQKISNGEKGGFKQITHKDSRFIALKPINIAAKFDKRNNFNDIKEINSIKVGLAVSTKLIIARNAGLDILECINDGDIIPGDAFKNAAMDLKKLHLRNIYLRDIKPENTTYDNKNVNFIDVEDRVSAHINADKNKMEFTINGADIIYTENYLPKALADNIYGKNNGLLSDKDTITYLKSADEYAFLLTMIAATTKNIQLRSIILHDDESQDKKTGKMNAGNRGFFDLWINENIKGEHKKTAGLLLVNPKVHANLKGDIYLSDMLLFPNE